MKIAVFTDTYEPQVNGVVVYLKDSLGLLAKENQVVLFAPGGKILRVEQISQNFKVYWIPASPFPLYEGYRIASLNYARIFDMVKKERPDIVHAHIPVMLALQGLVAAEQLGIPSVVTYHTHLPEYVPTLLNGKMPAFLGKIGSFTVKKVIKQVFGRADVVTAPTKELSKELRTYGLKNVVYLPNGIDFKKFVDAKSHVAAFRKRFGIGKRRVILYTGRVSLEKRLNVLLNAFKVIEAEDVCLVIVGSGPYLKEAKELSRSLGIRNVIFTGFVTLEELGASYACADIFASASDTETFGLTYVEAMHMGLPVVAVRMLGAAEVINDGKTGILVQPNNPPDFAKAMEKLISDEKLRKTMSDEARRYADGYSIEKSMDELSRIYRELQETAKKKKSGPIQGFVRRISRWRMESG